MMSKISVRLASVGAIHYSLVVCNLYLLMLWRRNVPVRFAFKLHGWLHDMYGFMFRLQRTLSRKQFTAAPTEISAVEA